MEKMLMQIVILIILLSVFLLIAFGIYRLFKRRLKKSVNQEILSEEDLKPFLGVFSFDTEEKIRKQWLISFFAFTGLSALSFFFSFIGDDAFNDFSESTSIAFSLVFGLFIPLLASIPWFWMTYHCSYKKKGTALLMWIIITLPLAELAGFGKLGWNQAADLDSLEWFVVIAFLGIEIFYWINCLRLRRVNSARKHQRVLAMKAKYGPDTIKFSF